jgi:hypothetical protein
MGGLSLLSMHRSYNAEKSAAETVGGGLEQAGSPTIAHIPSLTTLAHVGEAREVGGQGEGFGSWHPACSAGSPTTPEEEEMGWRGARRDDRPAATLLCPPPPTRGVKQGAGWASGCRKGGPSRTKVNSTQFVTAGKSLLSR